MTEHSSGMFCVVGW